MFRKNEQHLQSPLFSPLDELPPGMRAKLEKSWAGTFRREVFERLNEEPFAVLYGKAYSRPNVPVNVLLGLEIMKAGKGWTDEELYEHFLFDLQVRYALGYEQLSEGYFGIRTLYEFRRHLSQYMQEQGENLVEAAFEQVTDAQRQAYQVQTSALRIDSTQVAISPDKQEITVTINITNPTAILAGMPTTKTFSCGTLRATIARATSVRSSAVSTGRAIRDAVEKISRPSPKIRSCGGRMLPTTSIGAIWNVRSMPSNTM